MQQECPRLPSNTESLPHVSFWIPLSFEVKTHDFKDNQDVYLLSSFFAGVVDLMILEEVSEVLTYIIYTIIDMGPDWPHPSEAFDARDWCGRQWHGELYWVPRLGGIRVGSLQGLSKSDVWQVARCINVSVFFPPENEIAFFFSKVHCSQYLEEAVFAGTGLFPSQLFPFGNGNWQRRFSCFFFTIRGKAAFHIFDVNGQIPRQPPIPR